jgi:hypothetical protein
MSPCIAAHAELSSLLQSGDDNCVNNSSLTTLKVQISPHQSVRPIGLKPNGRPRANFRRVVAAKSPLLRRRHGRTSPSPPPPHRFLRNSPRREGGVKVSHLAVDELLQPLQRRVGSVPPQLQRSDMCRLSMPQYPPPQPHLVMLVMQSLQVGVLQRILGGYPVAGIKCQHFVEEVKSVGVSRREASADGLQLAGDVQPDEFFGLEKERGGGVRFSK